MGTNTDIKKLKRDINKYKKDLLKKAREKGLYENFGQNEIRKLKDKYDIFYKDNHYKPIIQDLINDFEFNFCLKIDDNNLKD